MLDSVLGKLARQNDPNVLVGFDKADDAGVYQLTPELALVQTVDFFTPIVDDPYTFGQIAATNALSDIYAMGGRPLSALALVCFPEKADTAILEQILAGGLSKMIEAGCTVIGGHSIRDPEIKFGYAVTGTVHPRARAYQRRREAGRRLAAHQAARHGGHLHGDQARQSGAGMDRGRHALHDHAEPQRRRGRAAACGAWHDGRYRLRARSAMLASWRWPATSRWSSASSELPLLSGALECVRAGMIPGGLKANRDFAECVVEYAETVPDELRTILFDPQTAGGLLISVASAEADDLLVQLRDCGLDARRIGEVLPACKPLISVI